MAAFVQSAGGHVDEDDLNATINVVPLVDIMLVMLIIFLVTIPVIVKVVPVQLPNARNIATETKPENIVVAVTAEEEVFYNNVPVTYSELHGRFLAALLRAAKSGTPLPEVHIRADRQVRFEAVGRAILAAQMAGVPKVGFITEPRNEE
ncbi:ExbD/TolR family protein [Rhizomicrobium electricum]|jgi:biopolymer transport protein ExbD|uniref:Biopolymer transporter ExbD n=1 Tax=Rhizomicrobium electricum TaxID=480070 RepID=A0ABN1EYJ0_9PROT|nr:biopolymer transporter ExbD [Rhizomicrobium electricum]NIJ49818.1 biopolymer transport protein ExbD [Rhizomicrobium electricum]